MEKKREQWSSNIGFLMAAAGSAVGLGNLWKFPYMAGSNGGAIFLIFYFILLLILGAPILLAEMSIGRHTGLNAIDACGKIRNGWSFVGFIGVLVSFIILSYYSVIGGWVLKYIFSYIIGLQMNNPIEFFNDFSSSTIEPIFWHFIFMLLCALIVAGGISNGIERISKIFLPLLFIFIIIITVNSLMLPNAIEGVRFFVVPDFSSISSAKDVGIIFLNAMGQVFFSLSLGMGTLITYGSYLSKNSNLRKNAVIIPVLDSLVAVLAGFAILPAVFSFGIAPNAGPGLIFETLPQVFAQIPFGRLMALIFFILVFFAAITSAISLLEVIASYFIDNRKWKRKKAASIPASAIFILGCFVSLSFGIIGSFKILGMNIFDFLSFLSDKILMPLGGFLMCIFTGYIWGIPQMSKEIYHYKKHSKKLTATLSVIIRYIAPAMILVILVSSFI